MNKDLLNLTVHVFTEHLANFPRWCVVFSQHPHGCFRARADCPKAAFAAAWDSFVADQVDRVPGWLRIQIAEASGSNGGLGIQRRPRRPGQKRLPR